MLRHLFDTGFLTASCPLRFPASGAVFGQVGAPGATATSPGSVIDGSGGGAVSTLNITDAANYAFLRIDLGAAQSVARVVVRGVVATGCTQLRCYVSNTASTTNPTVGAALAGAVNLPASPVIFDGSAAPVTGRYLYISPGNITGAGGVDIAELDIFVVTSLNFAVLQSISVSAGYQAADLRTTAHQSKFPIDVAWHAGIIHLDAKIAEIEQGALAAALGCDPVTGVSWATLKPIDPTTPLPALSGLFVGKDSNGKQMRLRVPRLYCPGAKLDFALGQFATQSQSFYAYIDPASGTVASWELEN